VIGLLQRVSFAKVEIDHATVGEIGRGLLVLVCAERGDDAARAERLLDRVLNYRVFADDAGRMNRSLVAVGGGLLLVPQFTLAADTRSGTRPGFSRAAAPELGSYLFEHLLARARERHTPVETGVFGASMQVSSTNDGPVTFWLRVDPAT
jgi:D-tyrosyl-tRNA(Tyr) deacylase